MKFTIFGKPIALMRPRLFKNRVYDPQKDLKKKMALEFTAQMTEKGYRMISKGSIDVSLTFYCPFQNSASKSFINANLNNAFPLKPDLDNQIKFPLDVMSGIVYEDDRFVSRIFAQKLYGTNPRSEIILNNPGGPPVNEHALCYQNKLSNENIDFLVKKANHLGYQGRDIYRVFTVPSGKDTHVYFEVDPVKPKK